MEQATKLFTLPPELQLLITSYLSPPEKVLLRMTCTHFQHLLPPPSEADLKAIENSFYNHKHYGLCLSPSCMRLYSKHNWKFGHDPVLRCRVCGNEKLLFDNPKSYFAELNWNADEKQRLRKLRWAQGLVRAFWDKGEVYYPW